MLTHPTPGSSHIREMRYDEATRTLYIDFRAGVTYAYSDVPIEVFNGAVIAGSAGKYFQENIKMKYDGQRV